eukprot:8409949-Karenia_brevis.AAC.1
MISACRIKDTSVASCRLQIVWTAGAMKSPSSSRGVRRRRRSIQDASAASFEGWSDLDLRHRINLLDPIGWIH